MALLEDLAWRYATKKYDSSKKVTSDLLEKICEAARLAPTSSGLQPFQIFVISNQELKEKIQPIANGQTIVADASHLLVFAAWDRYTAERIDAVYDKIVADRGLPADAFKNYTDKLKNGYLNQSAEENFVHTARQTYIALGIALAQAAELKVDSTPMEGFNNAQLDELLELEKLGLKSVSILALGYRDAENDWLVKMKKVRSEKENLFIEIK